MKKVFISYSDKDKNKMRSLEKLISKSNKLSSIIIADNRQALTQLTQKVSDGIKECDYFIPIITKNSMTNQWVNQEIGFATALNKNIIPIASKGIIDKLKGFIHKQLDLSYSFTSKPNSPRSEATLFAKTSKILVDDILIKNKVTPTNISIQSMFPGKWESKFTFNGRPMTEDIEIKDGNQYYTKNVHWFNLDDVFIDIDKNVLKFKKNGLRNDNRQLYNDLKIIKLGEEYKGTELNKQRKEIDITYSRVQ